MCYSLGPTYIIKLVVSYSRCVAKCIAKYNYVLFITPFQTKIEFCSFIAVTLLILCMYIAAAPVSNVTIHNESVTSSTFTLTWMEINLTSSNFRHYRVFYLPVRGPYGPVMTSNRRKKQSAQVGELTMNFTGTTGTLTNLYGAVTYRIQVAIVTTFDGQEIIGDRSAAIEMNTLEGGKKNLYM